MSESQISRETRNTTQNPKSDANMGVWSAENATKAYLATLKMGKKGLKEADMDVAELISVLAAGNNAQLMVAALSGTTTDSSIFLSLLAAANQTGGRVVCILRTLDQLQLTKDCLGLGHDSSRVEFVIGQAESVLMSYDYSEADFAVVDCKLGNHGDIVRGMHKRGYCSKVVVGCNALCDRFSLRRRSGLGGHILPIGGGLLVTRIAAKEYVDSRTRKRGWVVKVDECTGEEHVFRVRPERENRGEAPPVRCVSL